MLLLADVELGLNVKLDISQTGSSEASFDSTLMRVTPFVSWIIVLSLVVPDNELTVVIPFK